MHKPDRSQPLREAPRLESAIPVLPFCLMPIAMLLATAAPVLAFVVGNPGPVVLTLDFLDLRYETATSGGHGEVGFRFDASAPLACSDRRNNDDHRAVGQGAQDFLVDFPDDPECSSADDDSEDKSGYQPRAAVVMVGFVDEYGRLQFPAGGVQLPPRYYRSAERALGGDGVVINTYEASSPVLGRIDPAAGKLMLELRLRLKLEVAGTGRLRGPGPDCYLSSEREPHTIVLVGDGFGAIPGIHPSRPRGYQASDGSFVLAGTNAERVLGASCCGLFCFGDRVVERAFGIPAERGSMTVAAMGRIEPPLIPAERRLPRYRHVTTSARMPPPSMATAELELR